MGGKGKSGGPNPPHRIILPNEGVADLLVSEIHIGHDNRVGSGPTQCGQRQRRGDDIENWKSVIVKLSGEEKK